MFKRIWNSPTITTWISYSTKTLSLFGVLPLILKKFSPGDIVLWYLFFTIISLQSIADFGFRQTFTRIISYAFGGAEDISVFKPAVKNNNAETKEPNLNLLNSIVSIMKHIYVWLSVLLFVLMVTLGSWSMMKPINESQNVYMSWWAWVVVVIVSCISFYGKIYLNFLEGIYKIALVRRVETLTSLGSIVSSIAVLLIAPSLFNLVIINQFWVIIVTIRDWYLCKRVDQGFYQSVSALMPFDKVTFKKIWTPAWRSGISGLMSVGLTNLTGVVYAQLGTSSSVAAYLLAIRIINQIKEISMAPFYSKLPLIAIYRVKNDLIGLKTLVKRSMFLSHSVFIAGVIGVGIFFNQILVILHSEVEFVSPALWLLISFAFFVHRFGAMHIQTYISTNHIISHIADSISGVLFILSALFLGKYIGVYAIPVGMLVGYLGFYAWYAAKHSYRSLNVTFWEFELQTSILPIVVFLVYALIEIFYEKNVKVHIF
jgi:O-antigen/teichoic acid export membrane protein